MFDVGVSTEIRGPGPAHVLQVQKAPGDAASARLPRAGQKSVLREAREVQLAITLIGLGARLQFLESEVSLSRERLLRLYKEIKGVSPPKGQLPFSVDWYMTWRANIHASMFYNIYLYILEHSDANKLETMISAYRMYREQVEAHEDEIVLDFTRAYTLVRFFDSDMLHLTACTRCTGQFVSHAYDNKSNYVCVLCRPPSRAGKTRRFTDLIEEDAPRDSASGSTSQAPRARKE
jgi:flagellar transcriptional activator FlhC